MRKHNSESNSFRHGLCKFLPNSLPSAKRNPHRRKINDSPRQRPMWEPLAPSYAIRQYRSVVSDRLSSRIYFSLGSRAKEKHLLITPDAGCFYQWHRGDLKRGGGEGGRERRSSGQAKKEKRNSNMPGRYLCHEIPRRHSVAVFVYSWQCGEKQIPRVFSRIWNNFQSFFWDFGDLFSLISFHRSKMF